MCIYADKHRSVGLCARSLLERQLGVPPSAAQQAVLAHSCRAHCRAVCGPVCLLLHEGPADLPHSCRGLHRYVGAHLPDPVCTGLFGLRLDHMSPVPGLAAGGQTQGSAAWGLARRPRLRLRGCVCRGV